MIHGIWGAETRTRSELMESIWSFRHRHFVERFGWEALRKPDEREIDQFDGRLAIHLPLFDDDGELVGYSRLLPTTEAHLLSDVYPQLMNGADWPRGETIYEWTRCVAEPDASVMGVPAANMLLTGVLEYCLMVGITALIVETHPKLVQLLVNNDWEVLPLCAPMMLDESLVLPIDAKTSARALLKHHEHYGITGSIVDLDACSPNPLQPNQSLRMLPYLEGMHYEHAAARLAGE